jgi:hypothetical protein
VEPTSPLLIVGLLGACGGLLVLVVRLNRWAVKAVCGASVIMLAMLTGVAEVNNYYGYYTSWGPLFNDLVGHRQTLGLANATIRAGNHEVLAGTVEQVGFPGARSKINRTGLVYLPPQYDQARFSHTRFPVVELLHGSPGKPANWGSPGMSVGQSGDCSCGRWSSIGPQESMTNASAALGEWNP